MRKLFKFFTSRLFLTVLIILIEIILLFLFVYFLSNIDPLISLYFYLIIEVISIFQMIFIISTNGNIAYKLAWIFFIGAIPVVGFFCYVLFGNKKISRRQMKKIMPIYVSLKDVSYDTKALNYIKQTNPDVGHIFEYLFHYGGNPPFGDTDVYYYPLGDLAWPKMIEELQKAKHFIFIEYFILEYGKFFDSILEVLKQKSIDGVDIRIIYDDFGSISKLPSDFEARMRKLGIKCHAYNKFRPLLDIRMNNRDHRKLLIIDGHTGFTGGINLADEYVNLYSRFGHWKDNAVMIKGEACWGMTTMFLTLWDFVDNSLSEYRNYRYENYAKELGYYPHSKGFIQPYCDFPFDDENISQTLYVNILMRAKDYVYITTPYLILSNELLFALTSTAKRGIHVVILTPHIPDKKLVFAVTRSNYYQLLKAGVVIYEYTPGFVHSKMFISDDKVAVIGTANLDYRSMFLHMENGVFMYDKTCINDMRKDFENSLRRSQKWTLSDFKNVNVIKRMWWAFLSIFAPLM